jgi:hypothetical protein
MRGENLVYGEPYKNTDRLMHIVGGQDAATVRCTFLKMDLVSQIDDPAYFGKVQKQHCHL